MPRIIELRQQKTAIKNQMRDMLENAEKENRSLNDAEGAKFDELRAKAESLDKDISRLEAIYESLARYRGCSPLVLVACTQCRCAW